MNTFRCNMIGSLHCGREMTAQEVGASCAAHLNMGSRPHQWARFFQCKECRSREVEIASQVPSLQRTWNERRRERQLSLGDVARSAGIGPAELSQYEHLRAVSPADIAALVEKALEQKEVER